MDDSVSNSETDSLPVSEPTTDTTSEAESEQVDSIEETKADSSPTITFQGNSYDLTSVVGVTIGAVTLLSCLTCNLGFYCLPFIPIVLGIIGLVTAKDSVDSERTKLLSWISLGSGAAIILLIVLFAVAYIILIAVAIAAEGNGF